MDTSKTAEIPGDTAVCKCSEGHIRLYLQTSTGLTYAIQEFQQDHERLFLDLHANAAFAQFVRLWIKLECGEAVLPRVPNGLRALQ
jgi:hypothetical protein